MRFGSHHPIQYKLGVVRTVYECPDNIVTDPEAKKEIDHVNKTLTKCGYPSWCFKKVREELNNSEDKKEKNKMKRR